MDTETSKEYWETRHPQKWYSNKKYGTAEYWKDVEYKRFKKYLPYLPKIGEFSKHKGEKVLEIGIGVGTDLIQYIKGGSIGYGVDLTHEAIRVTKERLKNLNLKGDVKQANAEKLPFKDNFFDVVYSMGVLHHAEDMQKTIDEVYRVLKPGGKAIIWLYGKDWKNYFWFPFYDFITTGKILSAKKLMHKYMEVEGNVPIVRMFRKKEVKRYFKDFNKIAVYNHRGYGTSLGNKFKTLNMAFCSILNRLFPYNGLTVKAIK